MHVVLITNNLVRLSFVGSLLRDAGIDAVVLDQQVSAMEGSIGAIPRRLAVATEDSLQAMRILKDAGEGVTQPELTDGTLLGGKVIYRQKSSGYRTGIEPVLLAAFVPARAWRTRCGGRHQRRRRAAMHGC